MGRIAARNAQRKRWRPPGSFTAAAIPWVVFTDPEVAQVGATEEQAARTRGARVACLPMGEVDRAVTAGRTDGFVTIIAGPRPLTRNLGGGRVLGATIVAGRAGEMIDEVALARRAGVFTGRLAQTAHASRPARWASSRRRPSSLPAAAPPARHGRGSRARDPGCRGGPRPANPRAAVLGDDET
jgi:pyruvate/2-oxoglutarate dehydrogenase complex dihydrolipoamide dehydrogenase (E3) component